MRKLIAILAVLTWITSCWQPLRGQSPSVGVKSIDQKRTSPRNIPNQSTNDERGPQDSPLVVDIKDRPKTKEQIAKDKEAENRQNDAEWWNRFLTSAIAVAAFLQFFAILFQAFIYRQQTALMERSLASAKVSADAAKLSAEAARDQIEAVITANRPWFLLGEINAPYLTPAFEVPPEQRRFAHCVVTTKNHGQTPAKIVAIWSRLLIGDSPAAPPIDFSAVKIIPASEPYILPPGEPRTTAVEFSNGLISVQERDDVLKNKVRFLWLCGLVTYQNTFDDKSGTEYETCFCYLYETRFNSPVPYWTAAGPMGCNRAT